MAGLGVQAELVIAVPLGRADAVLRVIAGAPMVNAGLLRWLRWRRGWFLGVVDGRAGETTEFGELKLEVDIVEVVDEKTAERRASLNGFAGEQRHSLLILTQLDRHLVNLGTEGVVFIIRGFGQLLELLDFGFQILQVPFLALPERSLCGPILGLPLLSSMSAAGLGGAMPTLPSELTELGSVVNGFLPGFFATFSSLSRLLAPELSPSSG